MDVVVVLELCDRKEVMPVILALVNKGPEVLVKFLVNTFRLAVRLGMPGGGRRYLDSEQWIELPGELGNELGASVGYHT